MLLPLLPSAYPLTLYLFFPLYYHYSIALSPWPVNRPPLIDGGGLDYSLLISHSLYNALLLFLTKLYALAYHYDGPYSKGGV